MACSLVEVERGVVVAVNETGARAGFPVVVHHGMLASIGDAALFDSLAAAGRRVISLARPGYGDSSPVVLHDVAEWGTLAAAVLDVLQVDVCDILGISSGAPYAYALAARRPARTRRVYIFSGIPALYDARVAALWPHPLDPDASLADLRVLARTLFFAGLTPQQANEPAARDAAAHDCFGVALDLMIRCRDWGFDLGDIGARVLMQHAVDDAAVPFAAAAMTASLLPQCSLEARSTGEHFSAGLLDAFLRRTVLGVAGQIESE